MRIAILGAGGGLGRNCVDAACAAGHAVVALVRSAARARLPAGVAVIEGDALHLEDVARAMGGADAAMFCVMPSITIWKTAFPPLLDSAIATARRTGARLVFPANVWIYGPGRIGDRVGEDRAPSPASERGRLRAEMERRLREAGVRHAILRLPEFYGPSVLTLTARIFRTALAGGRALWPGPLDAEIELVYLPDAARAMVAVGTAADGDSALFHLPGVRTTPRAFIESVYRAAGRAPRLLGTPPWLLSVLGAFDPTVRAVADIGHLWTHPILLDGAKYAARFGAVPLTPLADAVEATLAWHRAHPDATLRR